MLKHRTPIAEDAVLYRIMRFDHVVKLLRGSMYFSNPAEWDDPYEKMVEHEHYHAMYCQCWSKHMESDALWRIYSPTSLGLKVRSTRKKIYDAIRGGLNRGAFQMRVEAVEYRSQTSCVRRIKSAIKDYEANHVGMRDKEYLGLLADFLYIKRHAFRHEGEHRALIYLKEQQKEKAKKGLEVVVDGMELVDGIDIDPRAPRELAEAIKFFLEKSLNFEGVINQSPLYEEVERLVVKPRNFDLGLQ